MIVCVATRQRFLGVDLALEVWKIMVGFSTPSVWRSMFSSVAGDEESGSRFGIDVCRFQ